MQITARGRYGLKAMIDIAVFGQNQYISLKSISKRQNISEAYLEQLAAPLKKAGLLKSTRGVTGGYTLGKSPEDIRIGDILRTMEGTLSVAKCLDGKAGCGDDCSICASKSVWTKITDSVNEAADSITLLELAEEYKRLNHLE